MNNKYNEQNDRYKTPGPLSSKKAYEEEWLLFWKEWLTDAPAPPRLPIDSARFDLHRETYAHFYTPLPDELFARINAFSQQEERSIEEILLTAFIILHLRYSGQTDIIIGYQTDKRVSALAQTPYRSSSHLSLLRVKPLASQSFLQVLQHVHDVLKEVQTYQDRPLTEILEVIDPSSSELRARLYNTAFIFHREATMEIVRDVHERDDKLTIPELTLEVYEGNTGLIALFTYQAARFEEQTIQRLSEHWYTLLTNSIEHPQQLVGILPFLTRQEWEQHLLWGAGGNSAGDKRHFPALFEAQVEKTPDAVALVYGDQYLCYRKLNQLANRFAHYLRKAGCGPEKLVGLSLERSAMQIICILAIFKAGAAYLPLDPLCPEERLKYIVNDASPTVIITTSSSNVQKIRHCVPIMQPADIWAAIDELDENNPPQNLILSNIAYVIYTSGSTGHPKGVVISHDGIENLMYSLKECLQLNAQDRILQFASINFDASIVDIVLSLLGGACLHIANQDDLAIGSPLLKTLDRYMITIITLPPSALTVLPVEALPFLRVVISAGEDCRADTVQRWVGPDRVFFNAYGPTETTVCATIGRCFPSEKKLSIGKPLNQMTLYVLDEYLQPVPIGIPGELYIAGSSVARGYLHRPDRTAECFLPDLYSITPGDRFYRTGDIVRYRDDGQIEFIGRNDHQVKIRGYRIELEEIEHILTLHPAIKDARVVLHQKPFDDKRLVAFVTSTSPTPRIELWPSVAEFFIYDELLYGAMARDNVRNERYRAALRRVVKDKVVLDVGTGREAILAQICVEEGAKLVYAVELLERSYLDALELLTHLQLDDKIILIHGDVTKIELPEKIDVCVSEIVGAIGGSEGAATVINSTRRFLKPESALIPERSLTLIAAVQLDEDFLSDPGFTPLSAHYVEEIFKEVGRPFDLRICFKGLSYEHILSDTGIFEDLDFTQPIVDTAEYSSYLTIEKNGALSGFLIWLYLYVNQEETIDILAHEHCWLPVYVPLFYPAIPVSQGDHIRLLCRRKLSQNGVNPDYHIEGQIMLINGEQRRFTYDLSHEVRIFQHNTFYKKLFLQNKPQIFSSDPRALEQKVISFLRQHLPEYMLPTRLVFLDEWPRTTSGKVDRQALAERELPPLHSDRLIGAPRTELEKALALAWSHIFCQYPISIYDDFFDLGGHSLLAIQLTSYLQSHMQVTVPIQMLYESSTVAKLAERLSNALRQEK